MTLVLDERERCKDTRERLFQSLYQQTYFAFIRFYIWSRQQSTMNKNIAQFHTEITKKYLSQTRIRSHVFNSSHLHTRTCLHALVQ